jgi:catechol 2,3-dioxygenase-like lactoylglutathione lyase family enzyme
MSLSIAKPGVDIGIVIGDVAAQMRFYGETLGLPLLGEVPLPAGALYVFGCGDSLLKLYFVGTAAADESRGAFGSRRGVAYLTINVTNIEAAIETLRRAGTAVITPLSEFDAGVELKPPVGRVRARYAIVADPEGNRVELLQRMS